MVMTNEGYLGLPVHVLGAKPVVLIQDLLAEVSMRLGVAQAELCVLGLEIGPTENCRGQVAELNMLKRALEILLERQES